MSTHTNTTQIVYWWVSVFTHTPGLTLGCCTSLFKLNWAPGNNLYWCFKTALFRQALHVQFLIESKVYPLNLNQQNINYLSISSFHSIVKLGVEGNQEPTLCLRWWVTMSVLPLFLCFCTYIWVFEVCFYWGLGVFSQVPDGYNFVKVS